MLKKAKSQRRNRMYQVSMVLMMMFLGLCSCQKQDASIPLESEKSTLLEAETFLDEHLKETEPLETQSHKTIYVHVCGCVHFPGVYALKEGARVIDAIDLAGGMTADADMTAVNLAVILKDEMRLFIPEADEQADDHLPILTDASGKDYSLDGQSAAQTTLVNINTATVEQLTALSGIGASRAADIIEYRNTYGNFDSIEELMEVPGIKEGVFEKIKDQITVN